MPRGLQIALRAHGHQPEAGPQRRLRPQLQQLVAIDPSLLTEDKDMLEDLVMAAMNDAVAKAEATTQAKMAGFAAGLNLPPGMGLPF